MSPDEYLRHDAIDLAELVAKKQVTPGELLDAALARQAKARTCQRLALRDNSTTISASYDTIRPSGGA